MGFVINTTSYTGGYRYFDENQTVDSGFIYSTDGTTKYMQVKSLSDLVRTGYYMTTLNYLTSLETIGVYADKFKFWNRATNTDTTNIRVLIYVPETSFEIAKDELTMFKAIAAQKFASDSNFDNASTYRAYSDLATMGYMIGVQHSDLSDFAFYDSDGKEVTSTQGTYSSITSVTYKGKSVHLYSNNVKYYVYIEGYGFTVTNNRSNQGVIYLGKPDMGGYPLMYASYHKPKVSVVSWKDIATVTNYASKFGYVFRYVSSGSGTDLYTLVVTEGNTGVGTYSRENVVTTELPYAPDIYNNVGENNPFSLYSRISALPNKADLNLLGKEYSAEADSLLVYPQGIYTIQSGNDYTALPPSGTSSNCYYVTAKSEDGRTMIQEVYNNSTDRPSYARFTPDITNINVNYTSWNNMRWG